MRKKVVPLLGMPTDIKISAGHFKIRKVKYKPIFDNLNQILLYFTWWVDYEKFIKFYLEE